MTVLHLVRHGESEANLERIFDGRDRPLTEVGRRQAAAVAARLSSRPLAALYASPYRRAQETASAVAAATGLRAVRERDIEEVRVGELAGRRDAEAVAVFSEVYGRWLAGDEDARFAGGESFGEACQRVRRFLARVARRHAGDEVAAVSHGGLPEAVLPHLLRLPTGVARQVGLAAITTLRVGGDGAWVTDAASWGSVDHLA